MESLRKCKTSKIKLLKEKLFAQVFATILVSEWTEKSVIRLICTEQRVDSVTWQCTGYWEW